jgi:hypothetical protein
MDNIVIGEFSIIKEVEGLDTLFRVSIILKTDEGRWGTFHNIESDMYTYNIGMPSFKYFEHLASKIVWHENEDDARERYNLLKGNKINV